MTPVIPTQTQASSPGAISASFTAAQTAARVILESAMAEKCKLFSSPLHQREKGTKFCKVVTNAPISL